MSAPAVLLVEDEALIALDLAFELEAAGLAVVGPVGTLADGLRRAREASLRAAVLDVNLRGEMSFPIADALRARALPLLFLTGERASRLPPRLRAVEVLSKPVDPARLVARVRALLAPVP